MIPKAFLFFTLGFLSLAKISYTNFIIQSLGSYLAYPAKNPTLLISGSVVTITSFNQWNLFDMRNIFGGTAEHMMVINALSILQFFVGWRAIAKKDKSEIKSEQETDSKIAAMQSEINSLKSKLVLH